MSIFKINSVRDIILKKPSILARLYSNYHAFPSNKKVLNSIKPIDLLTTSKILKNVTQIEDTVEISNRKLFRQLKPDEKIMQFLAQENLGKIKTGKYIKNETNSIERNPIHVFFLLHSKTHIPPFKFFAGATNKESFPPENVPEIAFIGRSNVGKSTLLNCLGNTGVARVSDRPGATQQINFYNSGSDFVLVDMPGYGFAYASDKKIDTWTKLTQNSPNSICKLYHFN
ncbi:putative GTP-binding protein EngB [Smittium culicis]|uniref:Putative GTP-binding protein EngB n=1 Tax=Smittium culicis TaxID=133412 RepID=A0A1R1XN96_9FUNG|nr:putative GTP-binding protein EngB [Smittium culicis]